MMLMWTSKQLQLNSQSIYWTYLISWLKANCLNRTEFTPMDKSENWLKEVKWPNIFIFSLLRDVQRKITFSDQNWLTDVVEYYVLFIDVVGYMCRCYAELMTNTADQYLFRWTAVAFVWQHSVISRIRWCNNRRIEYILTTMIDYGKEYWAIYVNQSIQF